MTAYGKQKIWIVLDHPMQLATALALAAHCGRERFIINLLVSPHQYWSRVDIEPYKNRFDEIFFMERPDYAWHPIRIIRNISQIWRLKKRVAQLNINQNDVIIGLSIFHYLENIVLSMHPKNLKIAIMSYVVYQDCTRDMSKDIFYTPLEGWVASLLIEPITGLHRTYCKKEKLHSGTYWRIRYKKSLFELYDRVVVMGAAPKDNKPSGERIYTMPFPYALAFEEEELKKAGEATKKKVVFFGDFFGKGIWGVSPDVYAQHLNKCLSYLRTTYIATHRLAYRPHPAESNEERKYLDLSQFEIESDGMLSELYFYKNMEDIDAVFSVASISSRSALHFFLNAYSFLDIFPFDSTARAYFKAEMGSVPDQFYIRHLSGTPPRYVKTENINSAINSCQNTLNMVLQKQ